MYALLAELCLKWVRYSGVTLYEKVGKKRIAITITLCVLMKEPYRHIVPRFLIYLSAMIVLKAVHNGKKDFTVKY